MEDSLTPFYEKLEENIPWAINDPDYLNLKTMAAEGDKTVHLAFQYVYDHFYSHSISSDLLEHHLLMTTIELERLSAANTLFNEIMQPNIQEKISTYPGTLFSDTKEKASPSTSRECSYRPS